MNQYVIDELAKAPEPKQQEMLDTIMKHQVAVLEKSTQTEDLAAQYAVHRIISEIHSYDRFHIACAAVNGMDVIISFNLTHINRLSTKENTELVNRLNGYPAVTISLPMEVIEYEDD